MCVSHECLHLYPSGLVVLLVRVVCWVAMATSEPELVGERGGGVELESLLVAVSLDCVVSLFEAKKFLNCYKTQLILILKNWFNFEKSWLIIRKFSCQEQ